MLSLEPVAGARLTFTRSGSLEKWVARTDSKGRYSVRLEPFAAGYRLNVRHTDYLENYFDEVSPPYHRQDLEDRQSLKDAYSTHPPWIGETGREKTRDLVLFPWGFAKMGESHAASQ